MAKKQKKRAKKEARKGAIQKGAIQNGSTQGNQNEELEATAATNTESSPEDSKEELKQAPIDSAKKGSSSGAVSFLQGTKEELDKVVWPGRQQLISESAAVILMVSLSATLIYLVDNLFSWISRQVF